MARTQARIINMGTYYYIKDPDLKEKYLPVYEDDFIEALFAIAEKYGIEITDEMILEEIKKDGELR